MLLFDRLFNHWYDIFGSYLLNKCSHILSLSKFDTGLPLRIELTINGQKKIMCNHYHPQCIPTAQIPLSLSLYPYRLPLLISTLDGIQYLHIIDEYKLLLIGQYWCVHVHPVCPQECPQCHGRLTWMVCEMGCKQPYSCCFVGFVQNCTQHSCVVPI